MPLAAKCDRTYQPGWIFQPDVLFDVQGADLFTSTSLMQTSQVHIEFYATFQKVCVSLKAGDSLTETSVSVVCVTVMLGALIMSLCSFQFNPQRRLCIFGGHLMKQRLALIGTFTGYIYMRFPLKAGQANCIRAL